MSRVPLADRTIWITGASSGIGLALARRLSGRGNHLVLTARNEPALEALKAEAGDHCRVTVLPADLSKDACLPDLKQALGALPDGLDTMILSAGNCEYIDAGRFSSAMVDRMSAINLVGMARCIEAGLPVMRRSDKRPHIVGIGSAAAISGLPRAEAYGASKAAVNNMLESLGLDLAPEGIDVSIVVPGFVDTPLTRRNDFPMPFLMDDETATDRIIRGIERRQLRIAFPWQLITLLKALRLMPESVRIRLGQKMVRTV